MPIAVFLPALLEAEIKTNSPDLTRYVLVCVAMLGLVLALAYAFRRLLLGNLKRRAEARSLQVIDMLPMGGKQRLVVVRCYDRHFLIGLGDKELCSIAELDSSSDELPVSSVLELPGANQAINRRGFAGALESVLAKWKKAEALPVQANAQPRTESTSPAAPRGARARPQTPSASSPARRQFDAHGAPLASRRPPTAEPSRVGDWNREEGILG